MRSIFLAITVLSAAVGFAGVFSSGASAAQLTTPGSNHQVLLASTTPSPTVHASTSATATVKPATATVAAVPKTGGPPAASGTSSSVYLLAALGALAVAGGAFMVVKLRRTA